jgi:hypothetical protein
MSQTGSIMGAIYMNKITIVKPEISLAKSKDGNEVELSNKQIGSGLTIEKDGKVTEVTLGTPIKNQNDIKDFSDILDLELTQSAFGV